MRLRDATRDFVPRAAELLGVLYVLHRRELLRSEFVSAGDVSAGRIRDVHDVSVAFCDLVGYTRLGERVPAGRLGAIATRLAVLAADAVRPPVRLVKTLGDAAMLVAPEPDALLRVLLDLMDAARAEGDGFPRAARGGRLRTRAAAMGRLVRRHGKPRGPPRRVGAGGDRPDRRPRARTHRRPRARLGRRGRQGAARRHDAGRDLHRAALADRAGRARAPRRTAVIAGAEACGPPQRAARAQRISRPR